jgi:2'-5' RNA ligase
MRLFFAVPASQKVREAVRTAIESFPVDNPPWRWIPPENFHLTLKFLGETDEDMVPPLHDTASAVSSRIAPFSMAFGGFGGFPSLSRPRVLFFSITSGFGALAELAALVEDAVAPLGFAKEHRSFRAHLTLARIKRRLPPAVSEKLLTVPPLPTSTVQEVDHFVLMRSHLRREGAMYEEIGSFPLRSP